MRPLLTAYREVCIYQFQHNIDTHFIARRPEAQIGESAYPVSPIGNFGTIM